MVSVSCCFSEKLQTNILIFSKKPNQIESQYFHQHQILRLFIVCMKPWWKLIQSKKYQGLSYSYDKPCRQHSKPINFDKSWNIFLNSKYFFVSLRCSFKVKMMWTKCWNFLVIKLMKYFSNQNDDIFLWPNWWNIFVPKIILRMKWLNNFEEKKNNYLKILTIYFILKI